MFAQSQWAYHQHYFFGLLSCMNSVSPGERERFYLHSLPLHAIGPQFFRALRTVNGHTQDINQKASVDVGLAVTLLAIF